MIRLFVIDQQAFFRQGICSSLSQLPDIEILGEADVGERVIPTIESLPPDVVLLGVDAAPSDGLQLCHMIKQHVPSVAVIVLSSQLEDDQFFKAIKAQASAYLSKMVTPEELESAIRRCANGEHPINDTLINRPKVAEQILQQFHELSREKEAATFVSPLTVRETEILNYIAQGYLNKQIADVLDVSEQTIKNHVTSILRKLNVNARTQAVVVAIRKGLVSIDEE